MLWFLVIAAYVAVGLLYLWLLATAPGSVRAKLQGMPVSLLHLIFSRDNKWGPLSRDPAEVIAHCSRGPETVQRKRVYFIRHGESIWNEVFNRGHDVSMVYRLFTSIIQEIQVLNLPDSVFWDSPLSPSGIRQSIQLSAWLEHMRTKNSHAALLCGDDPSIPSVVCVSNLRRAVSTILTGLSGRLSRAVKEQVHVVSCAQEITRNIDGYSLSDRGCVPCPSWVEQEHPELDHVTCHLYKKERLDGSSNRGNKSLLTSNGKIRMEEFCNFVFNSDTCSSAKAVILGGHSLWFREFFKLYLPASSCHESKTKKIVNCGVIAFDLITSGENEYAVDPDSIEVVYGGFEEKKAKLKV
jgi:hypothetical protein